MAQRTADVQNIINTSVITQKCSLIYTPHPTILTILWSSSAFSVTACNKTGYLKEAAQDEEDRNYVYDKIPVSTIASSVKKGLRKWQAQWERAVKGAISISFFPNVEQRLRLRIPITAQFTAIVSGHGKTRAYLNRFKIIDDPMCPCNEGEQTVEHLIYECNTLEQRRSTMIRHITTRGYTNT